MAQLSCPKCGKPATQGGLPRLGDHCRDLFLPVWTPGSACRSATDSVPELWAFLASLNTHETTFPFGGDRTPASSWPCRSHWARSGAYGRSRCRDSSAGRAPEWKPGCPQFSSGSRHQGLQAMAERPSPVPFTAAAAGQQSQVVGLEGACHAAMCNAVAAVLVRRWGCRARADAEGRRGGEIASPSEAWPRQSPSRWVEAGAGSRSCRSRWQCPADLVACAEGNGCRLAETNAERLWRLH